MITTICPHCENVSNHHTPVGSGTGRPVNGDASICTRCGEVSIFDSTLGTGVRPPTQAEQAHIAQCPEVSYGRANIVSRDL
jgi:hypothetical protein